MAHPDLGGSLLSPHNDTMLAEIILGFLTRRMAAIQRRPFVLGICGAQGSGKSTLARQLCMALDTQGAAAATLSLDDVYLTHAERVTLAQTIHPLLATRGVPGTHDLDLAEKVIAQSALPGTVKLPRFDKARDDRCPPHEWAVAQGPLDVLILEGWCVGARPQEEYELAMPTNDLERTYDADGVWRHWVNARLSGSYQALFARVDALILLAAPGFEVVQRWRSEQERPLQAAGRGMSDADISQFIQHYQRLTEHILRDMPAYADLTLRLDENRRVLRMEGPLAGRAPPATTERKAPSCDFTVTGVLSPRRSTA